MADPRKNIPNKNTNSDGWKLWHKDLASSMSNNDANTVWLSYWNMVDNKSVDTRDLRDYMKKQGIDISTGIDSLRDKAGDIGSTIGSFFKGGMIVTAVVGGILIFAILKAVLNIAKDPIGATNAVGNLKSGGLKK